VAPREATSLTHGTNAIVAIAAHGPALVLNQAAVDRGFFRCTRFVTASAAADDATRIAHPLREPEVTGLTHADYSLLDEGGLARLGERVPKGRKAALIGRVRRAAGQLVSATVCSDAQMYGTVDAVKRGELTCEVRLRQTEPPRAGDVHATRHGLRGVVGLVLPAADMPFTKEGMAPDLILNPHAFPETMAVGQLLESLFGKLCCLSGALGDGTAFERLDVAAVGDMLQRDHGFHAHGDEIMYDGRSGDMLRTHVFIGPVFFMRLADRVEEAEAEAEAEDATTSALAMGMAQWAKAATGGEREWETCRACGLESALPAGCRACGRQDVATVATPAAFLERLHLAAAAGVTARLDVEADGTDDETQTGGDAETESSDIAQSEAKEKPKKQDDEADEEAADEEDTIDESTDDDEDDKDGEEDTTNESTDKAARVDNKNETLIDYDDANDSDDVKPPPSKSDAPLSELLGGRSNAVEKENDGAPSLSGSDVKVLHIRGSFDLNRRRGGGEDDDDDDDDDGRENEEDDAPNFADDETLACSLSDVYDVDGMSPENGCSRE
jgi:hypothetical protein